MSFISPWFRIPCSVQLWLSSALCRPCSWNGQCLFFSSFVGIRNQIWECGPSGHVHRSFTGPECEPDGWLCCDLCLMVSGLSRKLQWAAHMESTWSFSWLCCFCCSPMLAFWHSSVLGQSQTYASLNIQIISLNQFLSSSSFSFSASLSFLVDCPSLSRIQVCAIRQHAQTQDSPNFYIHAVS